jgi:hypothetical protein
MNPELVHKLLRYLSQGIVIFLLFKYVPNKPMTDKDILLITSMIILAYAVFDNVYTLYNKTPKLTQTQCNTQCSSKEHMASIPNLNKDMANDIKNNAMNELNDWENKISNDIASQVVSNMSDSQIISDDQISQDMNLDSSDYNESDESDGSDGSDGSDDKTTENEKYDELNKKYNELLAQSKVASNKKANKKKSNKTATDENSTTHTPYNQTDYNLLPMDGDNYFDPGSSFLPPAQWYPTPPRPPVCVTEKKCPVCPIYTEGTNVDLKHWDQSTKISPPANIDTTYINNNLNK